MGQGGNGLGGEMARGEMGQGENGPGGKWARGEMNHHSTIGHSEFHVQYMMVGATTFQYTLRHAKVYIYIYNTL